MHRSASTADLRVSLTAGNAPHRVSADYTWVWGVGVLIATVLFFLLTTYMLIVSKLLPVSGNAFLDWIRKDDYYCLIIPLSIPAAVVFVYLNWTSLKFFRHN